MRNLMMCCAGLAMLWGGAVTAQTPETGATAAQTETRWGTVLSVSETSIVITADDGRRIAFTRDAESAVPADLAPGQRVRIEYRMLEGGAFHAMNVSVTPTTTGAGSEAMPMTASPFPLLGLLGLVALGAGLGARVVAVRRAR